MYLKRKSPLRFAYISPWLLAAAVGLLVLIILTFALNNIKREKRLMTAAMLQKASTLMRVIQSGAKSSYLRDIRRGLWHQEPWSSHVQRIIEHLIDDPKISYLAVVDAKGHVIAHNDLTLLGNTLPLQTVPEPSLDQRTTKLVYQVQRSSENKRIFEVIQRYIPFDPVVRLGDVPFFDGLRKQLWPEVSVERPAPSEMNTSVTGQVFFLVVGLDMADYDSSLKQLYFQLAVLSVAMLLVGIGGWLSLTAVQGYRGTRRVLNEVRAFTALLVAKLPVGIIATDAGGLLSNINKAAEEMLAVNGEKIRGCLPGQALPSQLADLFVAESGLASAGIKQEVELNVKSANLVLFCHHLAIRDQEGKYRGQVLLLSNLTEFKLMERQLLEHERLAAIGRMAAGVAHEVRNPLSSIKGLALLLQNKFDPQSQDNRSAQLLIKEVERLNRTVSELLDFTRPAVMDVTSVDLESLVKEELLLLDPDFKAAGITIDLVTVSNSPVIRGDRDRLGQLLLNLFLNSIQAMEEGGKLLVTLGDGPSGQVEIHVEDNGVGMDDGDVRQAFFPYFTTKSKGSGIGLAISQKIVTDHGGTIEIQSSRDTGTVVSVLLPIFGPGESKDEVPLA
jgi:two-component system sensor histidine kinase HydH